MPNSTVGVDISKTHLDVYVVQPRPLCCTIRDEARVVLIPSGPAGTILHEQAEYRTATLFPRTPNRPSENHRSGQVRAGSSLPAPARRRPAAASLPFQDGDLAKMEASI